MKTSDSARLMPLEPPISRAGGLFSSIHRRLIGTPPDLPALDVAAIPRELLERARATWRERATSEFRSIQIMARFLTEVVGAGEPLDVYAGALDLVRDEIRHTELCVAICSALGAAAVFPDPIALNDPPGFLNAPMPERALASAITMLAINETISVGYVADLATRCRHPAIKQVLDATVSDEEEHQAFGWGYIRIALERFSRATLPDWRHLAKVTLAPHEQQAERALASVPAAGRGLESWIEQELADLGLFSSERQALVYRQTRSQILDPRLRELGLLDS